MYAGIEAGGTKFVCAFGSGPADLSEPVRFPTTKPQETLEQAVEFIRDQESVTAIGVACFGPVDLHPDSDTYGHITSTPKLGWQGTDVVGTLSDAFGVPIGFDTDVNGAALAEWRWGAAQGADSVAYVTVGTGVGVGVMVDGRLVHGLMHPEAGHVLVRRHPDDDFEGNCPYHGDCLEGLAAGPAVEKRYGRSAEELGDLQDTAVDVLAHYLAQLCMTLALTVSAEKIVLGGGVMQVPGLLDEVRGRTVGMLSDYLDLPRVTSETDEWIVAPGLGNKAGVLGAIGLAGRATTRF